MAINFDHSKLFDVTLQSNYFEGSGILNFPITNSTEQIATSGCANIFYISGLQDCLSKPFFTGFFYTNDINGSCSNSYAVDCNSIAQACNSIVFGIDGIIKNNYCHGVSGFYDNSGKINSQIVHSINAFNCQGGSQNTIFLSRACVFNNDCSQILSGTINQNTILFSSFDIIGKNFNENSCFAVFNIKSALIRGSGCCVCTGYWNLTSSVTCNLNENFCLQITGSNNSNWSLYVCNASGIQWLTRSSILEIFATGNESIPATTFGIYWKCVANCEWFNLSNWFSDQYVTNALSYPELSTNVIMSGNCASYVNIDCNLWIQPASIDTTKITDPAGICLYSNTSKIFSGNIFGGASLYGNIIFN